MFVFFRCSVLQTILIDLTAYGMQVNVVNTILKFLSILKQAPEDLSWQHVTHIHTERGIFYGKC